MDGKNSLWWQIDHDDDPWRNLASAVVLRALKDYQDACVAGDKVIMGRLEKFFRSEWCELLTPVDMVRASKLVREKVEKEGDFKWYM